MIRSRWLVLAFLLALPLFVLCKAPASLLVPHLSGQPVAGAPLLCDAARGTVWAGGCHWRWRDYQGSLDWALSWRAGLPGLELALGGDIRLQGWVGGLADSLRVAALDGQLPASLLEHLSPARAEGTLEITGLTLHWQPEGISDAAGRLRYSGGQVAWSRAGEAVLPALDAEIESRPQGAAVTVTAAGGNLLMRGEVINNSGSVEVYRAWPILLGVSSGGNATDVVFQASQPLWE